MRYTFRLKLMTIVGISASAFGVSLGVGILLASRMEHQLVQIQEQYIPFIELGPRLEADFETLKRSLQDSVAAQDIEALKKTKKNKEEFQSKISSAQKMISPEHIQELHHSMEDYYASAYDVSHRMIAGETGVLFVNSMTNMQNKQSQLSILLNDYTNFDQSKLKEAFSTISKNQNTNSKMQIFVIVSCLVTVLVLSLGLSRGVLRSLSALSKGLERFGDGDFSHPIQIARRDELGDVAHEANQMAQRIRGLLKDLESFSYSVAHDLRAPLRSMAGFSAIILEEHGSSLPEKAKECVERIMSAAKKMGQLIDGLLNLSRLNRKEIKKEAVNLSSLSEEIVEDLRSNHPNRKVAVNIQKNIVTQGDAQLLQIVLTNLLGNAWKFTSKREDASIEFGIDDQADKQVFFVRDNGAGFDMQYMEKLFGTFQRLHSNEEFEGTGIGLATVKNIINRHGGEIWAKAQPGQGAVFYFNI